MPARRGGHVSKYQCHRRTIRGSCRSPIRLLYSTYLIARIVNIGGIFEKKMVDSRALNGEMTQGATPAHSKNPPDTPRWSPIDLAKIEKFLKITKFA